tara:strand:- start:2803 stop:3033 length:231 start_codon:yes stop_codon:yes gene_type:complete
MKKVFLTVLILCVYYYTNAQIVSVADGSSISIAQGSSVTVGGLKLAPDQTYVIDGVYTSMYEWYKNAGWSVRFVKN